jgi:hypothetical protein
MRISIFFILTLFLLLGISHAQNVQTANPQSSIQQPPAQQLLLPAQQQLNDQILDQKLPPPLPITPDESRILSSILSPQMDRFGAIQDKIRQWQILGVIGDTYFVSGSTTQGPGSVGVVSSSWYPIPAKKSVMRKYGCNFNYPFIECKKH